MIKYKYGFDKLNQGNMWIESENEEIIDVVVESDNEEIMDVVIESPTSINFSDHDIIFENDLKNEENKENSPHPNENPMRQNDVSEIIKTVHSKHKKCDRSSVLFNNKYFSMISKTEKGIFAKCCRCKHILKGFGSSSSNFITHLKNVNAWTHNFYSFPIIFVLISVFNFSVVTIYIKNTRQKNRKVLLA